MVRALWTAASGMIAQQTNVDNIANNLANVNTTGYKTSTAEFKSLLYQTIQTKTTSANGDNKPVGAQVGLGTRTSSITTHFTQGSMLASENNFAFGIEGDGFFAVRGTDGETYYTRSGDFRIAIASDNTMMLATTDGYPVLDRNGTPIILSSTAYKADKITVSDEGQLFYPDADGNLQSMNITIGLYQFSNPAGLENVSGTMYQATAASGAAVEELNDTGLKASKLHQGYLEGSNVQVVDEMVNLITAQRAYEMNSKAIQAADDMLSQANQLKR